MDERVPGPSAMIAHHRPASTSIKDENFIGRTRIVDVSVAVANEEDPVELLDLVLAPVEGLGMSERARARLRLLQRQYVLALSATGRPRPLPAFAAASVFARSGRQVRLGHRF